MKHYVELTQIQIEVLIETLADRSDSDSEYISALRQQLNEALTCEAVNYFGGCNKKRYAMTRFCVEHQAEADREAREDAA